MHCGSPTVEPESENQETKNHESKAGTGKSRAKASTNLKTLNEAGVDSSSDDSGDDDDDDKEEEEEEVDNSRINEGNARPDEDGDGEQ